MAAYLTYHVGADGWVDDPIAEVWIVPLDDAYGGPDRTYAVFRRGGTSSTRPYPAGRST